MFELIFIPCMALVQQKCERRTEGMQKHEYGKKAVMVTGNLVEVFFRSKVNVQ